MTDEIPDAEKLVGDYLRGHSGVNTRVVGRTPDDVSTSWIKLTQLDASNDAEVTPDYLITYFMQLDCYAGREGGQPEANTLGRTARSALHEMRGTTLAGAAGTAVVSGVRFASHARIPDTDGFEPARERIIIDTLITMHEVS